MFAFGEKKNRAEDNILTIILRSTKSGTPHEDPFHLYQQKLCLFSVGAAMEIVLRKYREWSLPTASFLGAFSFWQ